MFRALVVAFGLTATAGLGLAVYGTGPSGPKEHPVRVIPLSAGAELPEAELSGLAWWGEDLILLPQYPTRFPVEDANGVAGASGSVFRISRQALTDYLAGAGTDALPLARLPFEAAQIIDGIEGFDGFEAIAFHGDSVFLAVEVQKDDRTHGVLVKGTVANQRIVIDEHRRVDLPAQVDLDNIAYEALVVTDEGVFAFFEANGACNRAPEVHGFDLDLNPLADVDFDPLEYRLTDATSIDDGGRFWATNYQWEGTTWRVGSCPLTRRFGAGPSHQQSGTVERLVELKLSDDEVRLTGRAPIQLELWGPEGRNWEGLERLPGHGFSW